MHFVHWHSYVFQDISPYKITLNENFLTKTFIVNKLHEPYDIYLCNKPNFAGVSIEGQTQKRRRLTNKEA